MPHVVYYIKELCSDVMVISFKNLVWFRLVFLGILHKKTTVSISVIVFTRATLC